MASPQAENRAERFLSPLSTTTKQKLITLGPNKQTDKAIKFEHLRKFERINVIGTSGSGKSTFARQLASLLDLPYHEMDRLFWQPNWQETSDEEFFKKVREVTSRPRWVLDGNYTRTTPEKWQRVQLVVWLDISFVRTVLRVTLRTIRRSLTNQELWPGTGNRESLRSSFFSKKSIIWWAITSHRRNSRRYPAIMALPDYSHICFVRLKSPGSVVRFLAGLRDSVAQSHSLANPSSSAFPLQI